MLTVDTAEKVLLELELVERVDLFNPVSLVLFHAKMLIYLFLILSVKLIFRIDFLMINKQSGSAWLNGGTIIQHTSILGVGPNKGGA